MAVGSTQNTARVLYILAAIALVATFVVRGYYVATGPLNQDETDVLQKAWQIDQGEKMYLDFLAIRLPVAFQLSRPFLWFNDHPSDIVTHARIFQVAITLFTFVFFFLFVNTIAGQKSALWAVILASSFTYFAERTAQVRAEPIMLLTCFAGLYLLARWRSDAKPQLYSFGAGILLGLAVMTKVSALFVAVAPSFFIAWEAIRIPADRKRNLFGLLWLFTGGVVSFIVMFAVTVGIETPQAIIWILMSTGLLRISESYQGPSWFLLRTLYMNTAFWAAIWIGFILLHIRLLRRRHAASRTWQSWWLLGLGWLAIASLVARRTLFQQDLLLPGLLLTPAGAILLASKMRIGSLKRPQLPGARTLLLFILLIGFLIGDVVLTKLQLKLSLHYHQQVVSLFWNGQLPEGPPVKVDGEKFLDFLRGEYDRIHYHPTRTLQQDLRLADLVVDKTDKNDTVLTDSCLPIKRHEPHRMVKASVFDHFAYYEANRDTPACLSLLRYMPASCDPATSPGERIRQVLADKKVKMIVIGYGVAALIAVEPETRGWFLQNFEAWFDPQLDAFIALPIGQTWDPYGG